MTPQVRKNNTVTVQGMSIEILPPEGQIKYLGQLIAITNAIQAEFDNRIKCAWASVTSHRHESD